MSLTEGVTVTNIDIGNSHQGRPSCWHRDSSPPLRRTAIPYFPIPQVVGMISERFQILDELSLLIRREIEASHPVVMRHDIR